MSKPTFPRWATSGATISTPSSGKQDVGWISGERPPFDWFNWLFNLIYQWLVYLDSNVSYVTEASVRQAANATQSWRALYPGHLSIAATSPIVAVAFGRDSNGNELGQTIVAADNSSGLLTSTDGGRSWNSHSPVATAVWEDVHWSKNLSLWIAVGITGGGAAAVVTSPDGSTWTDRSSAFSAASMLPEASVEIGGGRHLVIGVNQVAWSNNGSAWNFVSVSGSWWKGARKAGTDIAVIGNSTDSSVNLAVTTNDGAAWATSTITGAPSMAVTDVIWCNLLGLFFVECKEASGTNRRIYTSADGSSGSWTLVHQDDPGTSNDRRLIDLGYGVMSLARTAGASSYYTSDGANWTTMLTGYGPQYTTGQVCAPRRVVGVNGGTHTRFLVSGDDQNGDLWISDSWLVP